MSYGLKISFRSLLVSLCLMGMVVGTVCSGVHSAAKKSFLLLEKKTSDTEGLQIEFDNTLAPCVSVVAPLVVRPLSGILIEADCLVIESAVVLSPWRRGPPAC